MNEPTVVKRLHISGLTPQITQDHLRDRFKSFGTVLDLEVPGPNAFGEPRAFVYLNIETTPAQLRKCLNIMSGAHWRGAQLRLAEAKPRWDVKYASGSASSSKVDEAKRARHAAGDRAAGQVLEDREWPPRPADLYAVLPRRVIDPERWGAAHEVFPELDVEREDGWEFESADEEEEDDEGRVLLGHWRRGEESSPVYGRVQPSAEDLYATEESESEYDAGSRASSPMFPARDGSASPLFPNRDRLASPLFPSRADRERSASPLFPSRREERERSASSLFPSRAADGEREPSSPSEGAADAGSDRSVSPLFPTRMPRSGSSSPLFPSRT
ncbi:hypothetical protein A1Q2_03967 [Trichosporon asahii var. asahii CBS 8904]|uniref:RRM domain-containing protein n=1 Tax=Trichosporon asahii var. asahii (strain CBS 8904) TaxID=1220162 RepID=K1VCP6_TRIAC|nr:hypothetical protein A1Q2_03967 [Trichosporon asahii var. asahii CBS 8904]